MYLNLKSWFCTIKIFTWTSYGRLCRPRSTDKLGLYNLPMVFIITGVGESEVSMMISDFAPRRVANWIFVANEHPPRFTTPIHLFRRTKDFFKELNFRSWFPGPKNIWAGRSSPDHRGPATWGSLGQSTLGEYLPRLRLDLGLQDRILKFLKVSHPSPTESEGVALENFLLESPKLGMGTK